MKKPRDSALLGSSQMLSLVQLAVKKRYTLPKAEAFSDKEILLGVLNDIANNVAKWLSGITIPKNAGNDSKDSSNDKNTLVGSSAKGNITTNPIYNSLVNPGDSKAKESSNPQIGDVGVSAKDIGSMVNDAVGSIGKAMNDSFFSAPEPTSSQPRYWDENSPDYDPAQAFLGTDIMPTTPSKGRAADKKAYDQYIAYYNDKAANPDPYDGNSFNADYFSSYLPGHGGEELIDNGTNSYLNRTSNFITGAEAKKQADYFGNDRLTDALSDIDDNEVISKNSLYQFGYRPFTDASSIPAYLGAKLNQGVSSLAEASEQAWNEVSNLRNDNSDWSVRLFDTDFSGKAVDQAIHDARDKGAGAYDEDGNWMPSGVQIDPTMATQRSDGLWVAPASDGNRYVIDAQKFDDGGYTLRYQDAVVADKDGNEQHIPMEYWSDATKDYSVAEFLAAVYYPEMSLEEKEQKAAEMYDGMGSAADYGFMNINAPSYKSDNVLSEYAVPSLVNGALSSAAYLNPYTLAERASMAEVLSASGLNTTSQNVSDSGIKSYLPAEDNTLNTTMGVVAPIGESKLGSLGNFGGKGMLEKGAGAITTKIPGIGETWAGRELIPAAAAEGAEEVILDPLYALQESGLGAYADQAKNDQGLLAFDEYNRPIYENTDMAQRARNYIEDQPNNFVMGAALGGGIRGGIRALQHVTPSGREQLAAEKADKDFFDQYVRQTGGAFTRRETDALRRRAGSINNVNDSSSSNEKIPFTMQEFEEMLRNRNAADEMDDIDTIDAQVKRNVR